MAKAILMLQVEFDPEKTDAESIAVAADRLLETALSTPGILEEYGNPTFRECYCPPVSFAICHLAMRELMLATYGMFSTCNAAQACIDDADSRIADDLIVVTILGVPPEDDEEDDGEEDEQEEAGPDCLDNG